MWDLEQRSIRYRAEALVAEQIEQDEAAKAARRQTKRATKGH